MVTTHNGENQVTVVGREQQVRTHVRVNLRVFHQQVGDIVTVTAMKINGQWEGEVNGRRGDFPFIYIQFEDELENGESSHQVSQLNSH